MTKAEAGVRLRGYAAGLAVAFVALSLFIAAIVVLAQACVSALLPYVSGPVIAGLAVGLSLLLIVAILALLAKSLLVSKKRPIGMVFRWLAGTMPESGAK